MDLNNWLWLVVVALALITAALVVSAYLLWSILLQLNRIRQELIYLRGSFIGFFSGEDLSPRERETRERETRERD